MNHLLKMLDLSKEEIIDILNLADQLKYENKNGIEHSWVDRHCSSPTAIFRSAEANLFRILQGYFPAIWTV